MTCDEVIIKQNSKVAQMASTVGVGPETGQDGRAKQIIAVEDRCMMIS
jgi:hypothetical protein